MTKMTKDEMILRADQIAKEYGCYLEPSTTGKCVLVSNPRSANPSDEASNVRDRQACRRQMIAEGVMPYGMIGGES